jgi:sialic acid synthase SpsE
MFAHDLPPLTVFVSTDVAAGEAFAFHNVGSLRPAAGLAPLWMDSVLQCRAARDLTAGTLLALSHLSDPCQKGMSC